MLLALEMLFLFKNQVFSSLFLLVPVKEWVSKVHWSLITLSKRQGKCVSRLQGSQSSTAGKFNTFLRKGKESCLCTRKRLYTGGRSNFQLLLRQTHTGEKAHGIRPRHCCTPDFRWFEFHLTPCAYSWLAVALQMQLGYRESLAPNTLASQEWTGHDAGTTSKPATQSSASLVARSSCGFQSCHQSRGPPWNCRRAACLSGLTGWAPLH